jgi:nucleoside phosphorylase
MPKVLDIDGSPINVGDIAEEKRFATERYGRSPLRRRGVSKAVDVLIVTAIEEERDAITDIFHAREWRNADGTRSQDDLWSATVDLGGGHWDIGIIKGDGAGGLQTILPIDRAVRVLGPRLVILAGIAAGRPESDAHIGDIVVSTSICMFPFEKRGAAAPKEIRTSVNRKFVDSVLRFSKRSKWKGVQVRAGGFIATNAVIRDASYRDELFDRCPEAIALEMEGGAVVLVCENHGSERFGVIKAIVDFGDNRKDDRVHVRACKEVARFIAEYLKDGNGPTPDIGFPRSQEDEGNLTPSRLRARRVPRSTISDTAATFIPTETYGVANEKLGKFGCVILVGSRHSGRRTAARQLLAARYSDIYEFDKTAPLSELRFTPMRAGAGYLLRVEDEQNLPEQIGGMQEAAGEAQAGLVICAPPGHFDVTWGRPDLQVDWRFPGSEFVKEASALHLHTRLPETLWRKIDGTLDDPQIVSRLNEIHSTQQLSHSIAVLTRGIEEGWDASTIAGLFGKSGYLAICERVRDLKDPRTQSWFVALGIWDR